MKQDYNTSTEDAPLHAAAGGHYAMISNRPINSARQVALTTGILRTFGSQLDARRQRGGTRWRLPIRCDWRDRAVPCW